MKFQAYDKNGNNEGTKFLALRNMDDGVILHFVDSDGSHILGSNLLKINNDGTLSKFNFPKTELGIKKNTKGCIKTSKNLT